MSDEGGVAAVDRALSILEALTDEKNSLADISKRTGLYKSTVLRLTKSLEKFGYVHRSEEGSYRLGSKVFHLGSIYQRHFNTGDLVPPVLRRIAEELKEGASFYIGDGDKRVCLHRVDATRAVQDSVHEGDRLPLTVGAAGHVIRAFQGVRGEQYDEIRRELFAASFGERDAETAAMACPVFSVNQRFLGVLSVSGPRYRLEALGVDRVKPVLFKHAKALTKTLGGDVDALELSAWSKAPAKAVAAKRRPKAT
ncbi:IclR family transcriptional regulator [Aquincola sp. MAHUQ-54]|uniref:IclR family transcriptional regulator n=1 Tax=Aquincola agrisoli TaxID=3119538 RepID=A0AAW9QB34_9BURK